MCFIKFIILIPLLSMNIYRSAFTHEVLDSVLHNALTAMSFEDMGKLLRTNRITKYLKDREQYELHKEIFIGTHKSSLTRYNDRLLRYNTLYKKYDV